MTELKRDQETEVIMHADWKSHQTASAPRSFWGPHKRMTPPPPPPPRQRGTFNECKLTVLHFKLAIKCNDYINIHTAVAGASGKSCSFACAGGAGRLNLERVLCWRMDVQVTNGLALSSPLWVK